MNQSYALLSVSDKSGIVDFAKGLITHGFRLLYPSGGTYKLLKQHDLAVTDGRRVHRFCRDDGWSGKNPASKKFMAVF
ncbi:MAG: hypothetical protein U1E91_01030 [Moraxella sp.]